MKNLLKIRKEFRALDLKSRLTARGSSARFLPVNPRCSLGEAVLGWCASASPCFFMEAIA